MNSLKKKIAIVLSLALMLCTFTTNAYAEQIYQYSSSWYTTKNETTGELIWHILDEDGNLIKNAWICDYDSTMEENPWYLIDENGDMVVDPVVMDGKGYYYAINNSVHDGSYGHMLRKDGEYYGVHLTFNENHDGHYGSITNYDGVKALTNKFPVKEIDGTYTTRYVNMPAEKSSTSHSTSHSSSHSSGSSMDRYSDWEDFWGDFWEEEEEEYEITFSCNNDYFYFIVFEDGEEIGIYSNPSFVVKEGTKLKLSTDSITWDGEKNKVIASPSNVYVDVDGNVVSSGEPYEHNFNVSGWKIDDATKSNSYTVNGNIDICLQIEDAGCILAGTLITLADGSQKKVEDLKADDVLLVYDFFEGRMMPRKMLGCVRSESEGIDVIRLKTTSGNELAIVDYESVFDMDAKKFVTISADNYQDMVGKRIMRNNNGHYAFDTIEQATLTVEDAVHYEIYTEKSLSYIANNLLVRYPYDYDFDYYLLDSNYKVDQEELDKDIEKYGLYTYDQFADVVSEDFFDKFNIAYFKVLVDKAGIPWEIMHEGFEGFEDELKDSLTAIGK